LALCQHCAFIVIVVVVIESTGSGTHPAHRLTTSCSSGSVRRQAVVGDAVAGRGLVKPPGLSAPRAASRARRHVELAGVDRADVRLVDAAAGVRDRPAGDVPAALITGCAPGAAR